MIFFKLLLITGGIGRGEIALVFWGKGASGTVVFSEGLSVRGSGSRKWGGVCAGEFC